MERFWFGSTSDYCRRGLHWYVIWWTHRRVHLQTGFNFDSQLTMLHFSVSKSLAVPVGLTQLLEYGPCWGKPGLHLPALAVNDRTTLFYCWVYRKCSQLGTHHFCNLWEEYIMPYLHCLIDRDSPAEHVSQFVPRLKPMIWYSKPEGFSFWAASFKYTASPLLAYPHARGQSWQEFRHGLAAWFNTMYPVSNNTGPFIARIDKFIGFVLNSEHTLFELWNNHGMPYLQTVIDKDSSQTLPAKPVCQFIIKLRSATW